MSSCPPVVRETPFLGDSRDDEDTHNTIQVLTLEGVNSGAILPLFPWHRFVAARQLLRPVPIVLVLWRRLRLVGAKVQVLVGLKKKTCGREARWGPDRRIINSACMGGVHLIFGDNLYNFHSSNPLALSCITQSKLHRRFLVKIFHASLLCWICATSCTLPTSCWMRCSGSTAHVTAAGSHVDNVYPNKSQVPTNLEVATIESKLYCAAVHLPSHPRQTTR